MSALSKIGHVNDHKCPQTGNNIDPLLHEWLVASDAYSYFDKRRKNAQQAALDAIDTTNFEAVLREVIDTNVGTDVEVYNGEVYSLTCNIKRPALRLDATKLRSALIKKGMKPNEVDAMIRLSSDYAQPAKSFKVVMRGDASAMEG